MRYPAGAPRQWSDSLLDELRTQQDPIADAAIEELFRTGKVETVNALMRTLVENDDLPSPALPQVIRDYLDRTDDIPPCEQAIIQRGEEVFALHGPEIMLVLGSYSLSATYAVRKIVGVIYRTGYLVERPMRRVFETAQMVIDVMSPGGLRPRGRGVRTAQKVRLMHAALRHLLIHDPEHPWDSSLGAPVSQEDLLWVLMTFSTLVLEGLAKLGVDTSAEEQEAYLHAWLAVGRILGIREDILPRDMAEARALSRRIARRRFEPTPEGPVMAAALIRGFQELFRLPALRGLPATLMRAFLGDETFSERDVATMLGVPPADWTDALRKLAAELAEQLDELGDDSPPAQRILRFCGQRFVEGMVWIQRGGKRPPFAIPQELRARWRLR